MACACRGPVPALALSWDVGAGEPRPRRSPLEQAGSGFLALARAVKGALRPRAGPADRGPVPERSGR